MGGSLLEKHLAEAGKKYDSTMTANDTKTD